MIVVTGVSGSGKSTVTREVLASIGPEMAAVVMQDDYYCDQNGCYYCDGVGCRAVSLASARVELRVGGKTLYHLGSADLLAQLKEEAPPLCADFRLTRLCANKNEVCAFGIVRE